MLYLSAGTVPIGWCFYVFLGNMDRLRKQSTIGGVCYLLRMLASVGRYGFCILLRRCVELLSVVTCYEYFVETEGKVAFFGFAPGSSVDVEKGQDG